MNEQIKEKLYTVLVNGNINWTGEEILNRLNKAGFEVVEKSNDECLIPVHAKDGWCVYDLKKREIVAGVAAAKFEDCLRDIEIRMHRLKQGWKP